MNIQNIKKLLKAYFIENWRRDILWTFGIVAIVSFLYTVFCGFDEWTNPATMIAGILLAFFPQRVFGHLNNSSSRIHYLMIPANYKEKVTVNFLLVNVYAILGLAFSLFVGYSLGYLAVRFTALYPLTEGSFLSFFDRMFLDIDPLLNVCLLLSALFFGSIYFKKRTTLKTLACCVIIMLFFAILLFVVTWLNLWHIVDGQIAFYHETGRSYALMSHHNFSIAVKAIAIVFFYALSFLRMKETEA